MGWEFWKDATPKELNFKLQSFYPKFCLKEAVLEWFKSKCFGSLGEKIEFQDIIITSLKPTLVDIPRFKLKNQKARLIQTGNFVVAVFILPA